MSTNDKNRLRKTYSFFRQQPVFASGGGGGGGGTADQFWYSTTNNSIYTTGSVIIRGNETSLDSPFDVASDVFFYVSGSTAAKTHESRVSVFGGDLVASGSAKAKFGLSGSLTKLYDGTSYLVAGTNVTITSASNGQVVISSAGGSGSPAGSDTYIQYNNAGSFGASSNFTYNGSTVYLTGSFSQGDGAVAYGNYSHAEGTGGVAAIGAGSHAEGTAGTESRGAYSHAEGEGTATDGYASHSEGTSTLAKGDYSHAEGNSTAAVGIGSHAEGEGTIASGSYQHVSGKYNLRNNDFSLFVVGNGNGFSNANRSDVLRVNSGLLGNGRVEVTGSVAATVGLSGSLTRLTDGTSYLIAGNNVTITSASNGSVTISSTGGGSSSNYLHFLAGTAASTAASSSMESIGMDYLPVDLVGATTYTFEAILATTAGTTAYMDLYDYDGAIMGAPGPIAGSVLTGSSQSYTRLTANVTTAFGGATGPGIIEARIWCTPNGSNLSAICKSAKLKVV